MKKLWEISTSVHRLEVDQLLRTRGHLTHFTFQEPVQQVETISSCATTYPWPDPADSHALICSSAVDYGCHTSSLMFKPLQP